MLKRIVLASLVGVSALALAAAIVQGAKGRGVAANAAGNRGHFAVDVTKTTNGHRVVIEGGALWEAAVEREHVAIRLHMHRAREFVKDGNSAQFVGPARAVVRTAAGERSLEGSMRAMVRDRRNHEHPHGDRDLISIHFQAEHANFNYHFEGAVVDGDIVVFAR